MHYCFGFNCYQHEGTLSMFLYLFIRASALKQSYCMPIKLNSTEIHKHDTKNQHVFSFHNTNKQNSKLNLGKENVEMIHLFYVSVTIFIFICEDHYINNTAQYLTTIMLGSSHCTHSNMYSCCAHVITKHSEQNSISAVFELLRRNYQVW